MGGTELLTTLLQQLARCSLRRSCAIVIVAPSGSGKSTCIGRLLRSTGCDPLGSMDAQTIVDVLRLCTPTLTAEDREELYGLLRGKVVAPFDRALLAEKDRHAATDGYLPPR